MPPTRLLIIGAGSRGEGYARIAARNERQRTALARALLNQPRLLLADEPTGNLDPENAAAVLGHIREFVSSGGAALMVTHDEVEKDDTNRVIHLRDGKIVQP